MIKLTKLSYCYKAGEKMSAYFLTHISHYIYSSIVVMLLIFPFTDISHP